MRQAHVLKTVETPAITGEQMERINRYTRRSLSPEEVFVFTVVLCDNEVDRDLERFPTPSLEALAELFPGKTGLFDHKPAAEGQSARIFETRVEETGEQNSVGENYAALKAWAYMVRCEKNDDLILEIDGGIKKEVSVSCAVDRVLCSICGGDRRKEACSHTKGEVYDGRLCHHLLVDPTDAYEWSFVAVPAQKRAGVVKRRGGSAPDRLPAGAVPVSKARLAELERLAALGDRYETGLRENVVRLGLLSENPPPAATLKGIAAKLAVPELLELQKSFGRAAAEKYPLPLQLGRKEKSGGGEEFQI